MKVQPMGLGMVGMLLAPLPLMAQYPIIFNNVKFITMSQERCEQRAEVAMRQAGFTEDFEPIRRGAFGVNGRYSASIRCEADRGVVFFAVAGPDNATSRNLVVRLQRTF